MRKGIVSHVVYEAGERDERPLFGIYIVQLAAFIEEGERTPCEMIRAHGVFKASVVGGRID